MMHFPLFRCERKAEQHLEETQPSSFAGQYAFPLAGREPFARAIEYTPLASCSRNYLHLLMSTIKIESKHRQRQALGVAGHSRRTDPCTPVRDMF
jgi:hypothetical protein